MGALPAHSVPERAADPFVGFPSGLPALVRWPQLQRDRLEAVTKVDTNAMRRHNEMNKKMVQPVKKAMIKAILHKNIKELQGLRPFALWLRLGLVDEEHGYHSCLHAVHDVCERFLIASRLTSTTTGSILTSDWDHKDG
ncbi:unnamed protein product [Polarella glacialis]|uniref:Uncharacterized protein n=1 Tax=Polarella glacialis TaxID=89957 RepID=A0A813GCH1_POLGL|nr:unnamed protein product [Polarella glacialis]